MPTVTREAAQKLAQELKDRHEIGRESWRAIAESYSNPLIKAGTLCRIVTEPGWLPRGREILIALGLIQAKQPEPEHTRRVKRKIARMAKETKQAVIRS